MARSPTLLTCILFAAALCGWLAGRYARKPAASVAAHQPAAQSDVRASLQSAAPLAHASSETLTARIERTIGAAMKSTSGTEKMLARFDFGQSLAPSEFPAAIATLSASPFNCDGSDIAGYWAEIDPPAARQWFEQFPPETQDKFAFGFIETWSATAPRDALGWIEQLDPARRGKLLSSMSSTIAENIGSVEPERVLALLAPAHRATGATVTVYNEWTGVTQLFGALAKKSPTEATARALALPSGGMRTEAVSGAVEQWASEDPKAARAWAERLDDAALAAHILPACAAGMAAKDPRGAAEWIGSLPASLGNQRAMHRVMRQWSGSDAAAALAWIDSLPPESGATEYVGEVLTGLAEHDAQGAMEVALARIADGQPIGDAGSSIGWEYARFKGPAESLRIAELLEKRSDWGSFILHRSLVSQAVHSDLRGTAEWVLRLPEGEHRGAALAAVADRMRQDDAPAAMQWALALPAKSDSDEARANVASFLYARDPNVAVKIYAGMSDADRANELRLNSMFDWLKEEPERAEMWLDKTSAFTPEEKTKLRDALSRQQPQ